MAAALMSPTPFFRRFLTQRSKPTISCCSHSFKFKRQYTSVMIVPTGIGAAIGGYAGDALPVARALSTVVDCLITHPNVLNAAMLYWPMTNTLYVEGYALDRFAEGLWALQPVHQNRVGIVLDAGIEEDLRLRHLQVADAARASLGLPIIEYIVTDTPLEVEKWIDPETGKSTGRIRHPDSLIRAVRNLVNRSKVNAIAVVGRFPDDDTDDVDDYRLGMGVDLLAGVEAVISHLVVKEFKIPCAHAPAMSPLTMSLSLSPKSAAEEPLMITVEENDTVLNDTADKLGFETLQVSNYWEAIGVVASHKAGINPFSLRRNKIPNIGCASMHLNGHSVSRERAIS
ncbi:uncharacterized protein LOC107619222 isoform X2 [Arachis ipaensis]|uniref:uncharacterized protein LOC107619222 isoform X2 n=1 Tax=Arachis ipaensis TaxID=130454 RepID=UPI000A2B97EF|nr:uncharacterized protein LOC107619222 isoform X2 [Arachis ipaensis]XP_025677369.1 uncharacterized protein LOC112777250 isoform X2 [Arachis hypogaea]